MTLGIVFPGQGSQSVGMLADVAASYPQLREHVERAGEVLSLPLWRVVQEGPDTELGRTEVTQPALLAASVGLWSVWHAAGGASPGCLAGHSLGEYSALVCGGALAFEDGVRLVHRRGRIMQAAVPRGEGAMAAILGLEDDAVANCCARVDGIVSPANINAPGQVVIAGTARAVEDAVGQCRAAGAKRAMMLEVSVPSHCELMAAAAAEFGRALDEVTWKMPDIPVIHNVDARQASDVADMRSKLLRQLSEPVRWTACVEAMRKAGVDRLVECGPGKVLTGLVRRIDRSLGAGNLSTLGDLDSALTEYGG